MKDRTVGYYLKTAIDAETVKKHESEWEHRKKSLMNNVKDLARQAAIYLGKIEKGVNACDEVMGNMKRLKDLFEEIENGDKDLRRMKEDLELDRDYK